MRQPVSTHTLTRFAHTHIIYRLQHTTKINIAIRYHTTAMNASNELTNLIGMNMPNLTVAHMSTR